jgi:hypothetical protein
VRLILFLFHFHFTRRREEGASSKYLMSSASGREMRNTRIREIYNICMYIQVMTGLGGPPSPFPLVLIIEKFAKRRAREWIE